MSATLKIPMTLEQMSSQVHRRYYSFKESHNKAQVEGNKTYLKKGHLKVFESVMYKYLPMFRRLVNSPLWEDSVETPSIKLTRQELANLCHCSTRSIYDLLARLSQANVLNIEEYDEKENGYIITPNLWFILGIEEFKPPINVLSNSQKTISRTGVRQNLPPLKPLEFLNNKNKAELPFLNHEKHQQIYQEKKQTETLVGNIISLKDDIPGENVIEVPDNSKVNNSTDELKSSSKLTARDRFFGSKVRNPLPVKAKEIEQPVITNREKKQIIDDFWNYAHKCLFSQYTYDGATIIKFKNVIISDVFGSFNGGGDYFFWKTFYLMRCSEIDIIKAHNDKYDRESYFPTAFFSKKYAKRKGFLEAHGWTKKEKKKFDEVRQKNLLAKAQLSLLTNNPPRHLKNKDITFSELKQYWANRLGSVTCPEIVKQYFQFLNTTNFTTT